MANVLSCKLGCIYLKHKEISPVHEYIVVSFSKSMVNPYQNFAASIKSYFTWNQDLEIHHYFLVFKLPSSMQHKLHLDQNSHLIQPATNSPKA